MDVGGSPGPMGIGFRVVRGPDWKWCNQDGGEGHVGTVVEIGKPGSISTPDKTVVVQWDSGSRTNYRNGYQGAYDLRILDNGPIGVKHPFIKCNSCHKDGIAGMRWKCLVCANYDLCTACYMADKHDLHHAFARYETSISAGVEMPERASKNAVKLQSRGIFLGARVVRGFDWDWGNQDGGEGKVGKVIDIRGWDNESRRSVANVMWASGSTNVYRLGHKGKVDLKYVLDAAGSIYYRDHLPILGQTAPVEAAPSARPTREHRSATSNPPTNPTNGSNPSVLHVPNYRYDVGDKVRVFVDNEDDLRSLQEGHGGWNPRMAQCIGQVGTVHRVTDRGDIRVQFEGCHNRWTFHPNALVKVTSYAIEDFVRVIEDASRVKQLQKSHGEWIEQMRACLGKVGKVVKVYADGDLRVTIEDQTWTFNPMCLMPMPEASAGLEAASNHHDQREEMVIDPSLVTQREPTRKESKGASESGHERPQRHEHREGATGLMHKIRMPSGDSPQNSPSSTRTGDAVDANERLQYLESKIAEIEEVYGCGICMERVRNVVFLCGHGACVKCAQTLKTCHMCRETITKKINIY